MTNLPELLEKLEAAYPDFGPQLSQAAKYVLDQPEDVAVHSMREIARRCDVAPSTLLRVATALGFDTYESFKAVFQNAVSSPGPAFRDRAEWLQSLDGTIEESRPKLLANMASATLANVEQMFQALDPDDLNRAARMILDARQVYVLGLRGSLGLAHYLYYVARMVRADMHLPTGLASDPYEDLIDLSPDDVLVAFGFEPYTKDTVMSQRHAKNLGARLIVITDSRVSPVAQDADIVFLTPTESPQFFPSFSAATALVETLLACLVASGGEKALDHISAFDAFRQNHRSYWSRDIED